MRGESAGERGLAGLLPAAQWSALARLGVGVSFRQGQIFFQQGESGRHAYVLLRGAVKIQRSEPTGGQTILTVRAGGDVIGELAALDGQPRSATVTAISAVTARLLTGEQLRRFTADPAVSASFLHYTMARVRESAELRGELALLPVRSRLARALLRLGAGNGPGDRPEVQLSQQDLAQLVGASRNAVVVALAELRTAGLLTTHRKTIIIRDRSGLAGYAQP
ncbi:Crp/Fnr family transcriptional regulator [Natronosporangium hydrolyticum]|uniref:Crp/Fnr family transcriptional regulator n=1 Tax=Natronosporangium hydrolyticum TaxID=2811111 RepID=A0A895YP62_9ACTN|nr:Crp/Fnr family transcriptional regulator [Natronosporangium hydrolyticum]QSB16506.1 Crp/Fnr family transcriptional regulator [Natronosporangium hydrolyticum]